MGSSGIKNPVYHLLKGRQLSKFKNQLAMGLFYFPNTSSRDFDFEYDTNRNLSKHGLNFIKLGSLSELGLRNMRGGKARRPELISLQSVTDKADSYFKGSRAYNIQFELAEKALDLLQLVSNVHPALILDIGCGSGITSATIAGRGHLSIGVDINSSMLKLFAKHSEANAVKANICKVFPFRGGLFDVAVSISFLQWIIVDKKNDALSVFFRSLKFCLIEKGTAVLQFYPRTLGDIENTILAASMFFRGVLICDYPHKNRGKKLFIVLLPI